MEMLAGVWPPPLSSSAIACPQQQQQQHPPPPPPAAAHRSCHGRHQPFFALPPLWAFKRSRHVWSAAPEAGAASAAPLRGEVALVRDDLLGLISDQQRGVLTQRDRTKRSEIIKAIGALVPFGVDTVTADSSLSATWRMLWTTEKEQLFIIEKSALFRIQTGDILQVIDVDEGRLQNVITFPPSGAFLVNSTIEMVSSQRVNFRFTTAEFRGSGWRIPLPPYGQGWFESIYMDDKIRVAKDVRGDYLVVEKASYLWEG